MHRSQARSTGNTRATDGGKKKKDGPRSDDSKAENKQTPVPKKGKPAFVVTNMLRHLRGYTILTVVSVIILATVFFVSFFVAKKQLKTLSAFNGSLSHLYLVRRSADLSLGFAFEQNTQIGLIVSVPGTMLVLCVLELFLSTKRGRDRKCKHIFHSLVCCFVTCLVLFFWMVVFDYLGWLENVLRKCTPGLDAFGGFSPECTLTSSDWALLCSEHGGIRCYFSLMSSYNFQLSMTFFSTCFAFVAIFSQVFISDWVAVFHRSAKMKAD